MRSLLRGIIAVWREIKGMGTGEQRDNGKPVRQRANHRRLGNGFTPRTQKVCGMNRVVINAATAISSSDSARSLARLSSVCFSRVKDRG